MIFQLHRQCISEDCHKPLIIFLCTTGFIFNVLVQDTEITFIYIEYNLTIDINGSDIEALQPDNLGMMWFHLKNCLYV